MREDEEVENLSDNEEEEDEEVVENEADRAFIDDAGVPEDEQYGSDYGEDLEGLVPGQDEALEDNDDVDNLFGNKKKRRKDRENIGEIVEDMLTRMDLAAEKDRESHKDGRPALEKLRLLPAVEDFLAQRSYHETLVSSGALGTIKAWLQPHECDGALPSLKVRTSLLRALGQLPIDTATPGGVEMLRNSKLGRVVMLLSKYPDETPGNKKLARDLITAWSRPIFMDAEAEEAKKNMSLEQLRTARKLEVQTAAAAQAEAATSNTAAVRKPRPREPGYRWHAAIPEASKLDYVKEPTPDVKFEPRQAGGKSSGSQFERKMREITRKGKNTTARAMMPSVEGRGIVVYEH